jgi:glycosyltransferase involved in cell wall biosynthesis
MNPKHPRRGDFAEVHVLLIGNYPPDRQESMLRYATLLRDGLREQGVHVSFIAPQPWFGRIIRYTGRGLSKWLGYVDKFVLFPRTLRTTMRAAPAGTIAHICDHSNAMYMRTLESWPHVVTCHDVMAIRSALGHFPQSRSKWSGRRFQHLIVAGLRRARQIVSVSHETRRQLGELGGFSMDRIAVVPNGLNYPYRVVRDTEQVGQLAALFPAGLPAAKGFVFHVGGNQWYKNRPGVIRIYFEYVRAGGNMPLVMAGKPFTEEMRRLVAQQPAGATVIELGAVTNEQLNALYSRAGCLLFPSLCEGFGWPILEALASGCRVLTTNRAPMTEVGGTAAYYFDEGDLVSAGQSLLHLLSEESRGRNAREEAGLAWAHRFGHPGMLEQYIQIYTEIAGVRGKDPGGNPNFWETGSTP